MGDIRLRPQQNGKYVVSTRPEKKTIKVHLRFHLCKSGQQVLDSGNDAYYTFSDESELGKYDGFCYVCDRNHKREWERED